MNRIDIINALISRYEYSSYLEIGTAARECFDQVIGSALAVSRKEL